METLYREELRVGAEYEAVLMVCSEVRRRKKLFRARVWIGSVHEAEPLLYLAQECESREAAELSCRQLLRSGLSRLGYATEAGA